LPVQTLDTGNGKRLERMAFLLGLETGEDKILIAKERHCKKKNKPL